MASSAITKSASEETKDFVGLTRDVRIVIRKIKIRS